MPSLPVKKDELLAEEGKWILANINATGYYRVNYNPENWKSLMDQLERNPNVGTRQLVCKLLNSGLKQLYVDLELTMYVYVCRLYHS